MTAEQRIEAFKKDLQELLNKHKATIEIVDNGRDFMRDYTIEFYLESVWENGEQIASPASFNMNYVSCE